MKKVSQRLHAILAGAFAGPPTLLKDIPKRFGDPRTPSKGGKRRASSSSAKTVARRKKNQGQ